MKGDTRVPVGRVVRALGEGSDDSMSPRPHSGVEHHPSRPSRLVFPAFVCGILEVRTSSELGHHTQCDSVLISFGTSS